jgi:hypothetical protein
MTMTTPNYPVVMMSCTNGTNKDVFLNEVQNLSSKLMGKRDIEIKYKYSEHNKVTKWLFEHANITSIDNMDYTDDGMITL